MAVNVRTWLETINFSGQCMNSLLQPGSEGLRPLPCGYLEVSSNIAIEGKCLQQKQTHELNTRSKDGCVINMIDVMFPRGVVQTIFYQHRCFKAHISIREHQKIEAMKMMFIVFSVVLYFDQLMGAAHSQHWSKYAFSGSVLFPE